MGTVWKKATEPSGALQKKLAVNLELNGEETEEGSLQEKEEQQPGDPVGT